MQTTNNQNQSDLTSTTNPLFQGLLEKIIKEKEPKPLWLVPITTSNVLTLYVSILDEWAIRMYLGHNLPINEVGSNSRTYIGVIFERREEFLALIKTKLKQYEVDGQELYYKCDTETILNAVDNARYELLGMDEEMTNDMMNAINDALKFVENEDSEGRNRRVNECSELPPDSKKIRTLFLMDFEDAIIMHITPITGEVPFDPLDEDNEEKPYNDVLRQTVIGLIPDERDKFISKIEEELKPFKVETNRYDCYLKDFTDALDKARELIKTSRGQQGKKLTCFEPFYYKDNNIKQTKKRKINEISPRILHKPKETTPQTEMLRFHIRELTRMTELFCEACKLLKEVNILERWGASYEDSLDHRGDEYSDQNTELQKRIKEFLDEHCRE